MSNAPTPETSAQLLRALTSLKEMRGRLEAVEAARREPIAIIGMGCRLPGAANPGELWQLLRSGGDAITETPADRWDVDSLFDAAPDAPGKVSTRWGGFLAGIDRFDAGFFGISPREAVQMDPQQRLLLEVAWETLEDGGQSVEQLAGTDTGVFIGAHSHSDDYYQMQAADPAALDLYSGTGTSHSVLSGRLSYLLDLHGPSLAVDTACSSSLVAVHLAVQSLRSGECSLALAGGVNVMLDPTFTMVASRMRMMSPTGRCRPFDAAGDGFVRSEGCATVLLKRLSDAQADGDRVLAVIKGSAVDQDGRSNGLTAPNSLSQQAVISAALADAGVPPSAIDVVEAHGTGTPLGDPIEVEALAAVFGSAAAGRTIALGSVKANIGHTEGASGVAALIKTVLSLRAGEVAPMVHFRSLNPHISLAGTPLLVPTEVMPWPSGGDQRCAGVSSFGWSGTNAHVVVSEPPTFDRAAADPATVALEQVLLLPISARSAAALHDLAMAYCDLLGASTHAEAIDICATAALRRSHHDHRLVVTGRSVDDLVEALHAHLRGQEHRGAAAGVDRHGAGMLVFVFPGQGSQWPSMARDLMAAEPVFRSTLDRCQEAMAPFVDWSLIDVLSDAAGARLDQIDVVQPALFALQVALAALWQSRGIAPDAVVGHSMGEVAAAHVAGILSLDDAARIICVRSRLLRTLSGRGAMVVVDLDVESAQRAIAGFDDRVSVAVSNSRASTVLSGDPDAIDELMARLESAGTFCRRVNVDVASHSPQVDVVLDELVARLAPIRPRRATMPMMSTVTGGLVDREELDAGYWAANLRRPVRFSDAVEALVAEGHTRFVELSPHPLLVGAAREALDLAGCEGVVVASLRRDADGPVGMLAALGELYANGHAVQWARVHLPARPADLPAYPWQRERHWLEEADGRHTARHGAPTDSLLGWRLPIADAAVQVWENRLTLREVAGATGNDDVDVFPHSLVIELLLRAAAALDSSSIRDVHLAPPLVMSGAAPTIQVAAHVGHDGTQLTVHAMGHDGRVRLAVASIPLRADAVAPIGARATELEVPGTDDRVAALEMCLGNAARAADASGSLAVVAIGGIDVRAAWPTPARPLVCRLLLADADPQHATTHTADLELIDGNGSVLIRASHVVLQLDDLARAPIEEWINAIAWRPATPATAPRPDPVSRWIVIAGEGADGERLCEALGGAVMVRFGDPVAVDEVADLLGRLDATTEDGAGSDHLGVVFLASGLPDLDPTATSTAAVQVEKVTSVLHVAAALDRLHARATLWIATRGTHCAVAGDRAPGFADGTLWGLGRAIGEEMPGVWGGCIDIDPGASSQGAAAALAHELTHLAEGAPIEGEVALRGSERLVARLVPAAVSRSQPLRLGSDCTVLVSGGFGAVGHTVARWLAGEGVRRIVLLGRTELPPRARWAQVDPDSPAGRRVDIVRELEALGAAVHIAAVDVGDEAALCAFLDGFRAEGWPPIRAVFHAAAQFGGDLVAGVSDEAIRAQLLPKLVGAWTFQQLPELEHLVLFSSLAAVLPMAGQSAYAAGNAFLDSLAGHRVAEGLPAVSINWGFWEGSDDAVTGEVGQRRLEEGRTFKETANALAAQHGIRGFRADQGLEAMRLLMFSDTPQAVVASVDWNALRALRVEIVAGLATDRIAAASRSLSELPSTAPEHRSLAQMLAEASVGDRPEVAEAAVRRIVGRVLKLPEDRIDSTTPLGSLGFDSLMSIELQHKVERELGMKLSATLAWNYPSVRELAAFVLDLLGHAGAPAERSAAMTPPVDSSPGPLASEVDNLSEDEALAALLGRGAR